MIVLDANILIRAVLGRRVRQLLETYSGHGVRFYAPDVAYRDAEKYLPALLRKKEKPDSDVPATLTYLQTLAEPIQQDFYGLFQKEARLRLRGRDEDDWQVLAAALCPVQYGRKISTSSAAESPNRVPVLSCGLSNPDTSSITRGPTDKNDR